MNVYKEMNDTIKDIYSKSDEFQNQYVLAWILQLEKENRQLKEELEKEKKLKRYFRGTRNSKV